jgi:hypothetical protein
LPLGRSRRPRESLFLSLSRGMKGLTEGAGQMAKRAL